MEVWTANSYQPAKQYTSSKSIFFDLYITQRPTRASAVIWTNFADRLRKTTKNLIVAKMLVNNISCCFIQSWMVSKNNYCR